MTALRCSPAIRSSTGLLHWRDGLWCHHLHHSCRDEPRATSRKFCRRLNPRLAVFDAGLGLDDILAKTSAPCLPLGLFDDAAAAGFYNSVADCEPTDITLASTRPQDDACILYTSGTSARPKGVVLTFRELLANVEPTADGLGMTADDRIYDFRSFNWCSAQVLSALAPLSRGATLILGRKFTRSRFFQHVAEYGATITAGNPTTINMLLNGDDAPNAEAMAMLAVRDLEFGAALDRGLAALRTALRNSGRPKLWLQRNRLDRSQSGRRSAYRHRRQAGALPQACDRR